MFILSQFTYNALRFVELSLHKLVSLLWKISLMWQETIGIRAIGILPRASNWLETALGVDRISVLKYWLLKVSQSVLDVKDATRYLGLFYSSSFILQGFFTQSS